MLNKYHLIADFNIEPLKGFILNLDREAEVSISPYGQVMQEIYKKEVFDNKNVILWTFIQSVIPSFSEVLNLNKYSEKNCLQEVKKYSEAIINLSKKQKFVFLVSWTLEDSISSYGLLDWKPDIGVSYILAKINIYLSDLLSKYNNIFILNSNYWIQNADKVAPKIWYATKVPYSPSVFDNAAKDIYSSYLALNGLNKKIIILDLDNTLWGGVVGELGIEGVNIGGHNFIGEAYQEFQRALLALSNKGIQLAIVSKNDEIVALEVIQEHDAMVLRKNNFSGWKINWKDKASNIKALLDELNLGTSSAIFIDDSPIERDWVKKSLPEVLVPDWPDDPALYVRALAELNCLHTATISNEDRNRTKMYVAERQRKEIKKNKVSLDDWLISLNTKVTIHALNNNNIKRVTQLFNKTNQLNLKTRRLSEKEILKWLNENKQNKKMHIIEVEDRLGNIGLVGIISLELVNKEVIIEDFILSCRAMGRKIEHLMLSLAYIFAKEKEAKVIKAEFIPTKRNRPTYDIFNDSIFKYSKDNIFLSKIDAQINFPKELSIENKSI